MTVDTIYALSSGAGRAAVAVVRISGPRAAELLEGLSGPLPPPWRLSLRSIIDCKSGEILDSGMVVWLPGPRSFTGEDCAELHLHGSSAVLSGVMQLMSAWPQVRPAEPGEFTRRAFVNGKMDLVEVEGLGDLLEARTARQRRQAIRQLNRQASSVFESWREQLLGIRADVEAVVDFTEEPGVVEQAAPGIDIKIRALVSDLQSELERSVASEILRDGVRMVLAGLPNTGKSSLLNCLARREAAIVSDIPGTTRDTIEVTLDLQGIPVVVTDTAGLRSAKDKVEMEGIRRSRHHISNADILVWVWSLDVMDSDIPDPSCYPDLTVRNKIDLGDQGSILPRNDLESIPISTHTGAGVSHFISSISRCLQDRFGTHEDAAFVSARQKLVAERSIRLLNDALELGPERLELKAENIRAASEEIARLTGRVDVEEWLGAIFSRFCIGK
jgi:tRNA modification GTPase